MSELSGSRFSGGERGYPRPQLQRAAWTNLNGEWSFAIDARGELGSPEQVVWDRTICVPFSPETTRSGVNEMGFYHAVWYRRSFDCRARQGGERVLLHFGAVDYSATVWVNGVQTGRHRGGYTPFTFDVTALLQGEGPHELVVRAEDDAADLAKPRGKQDWKLNPHSIWYPRTTGIWQTVWLEVVPATFVKSIQWSSSLERWEIGMDLHVGGDLAEGCSVAVNMRCGNYVIANDRYSIIAGEVHRKLALSDPGIDDYRNELLWSPASPTLLYVDIELRDADNQVIELVQSYTALRAVDTQGDRFILNGRPLQLRLVLDQGYWPESGITAPDDEALLLDILLAKRLGFNGVRKHQKIEDPRFLYWADHVGLLVWEEMPSAYRYTSRSVTRLTTEWMDVLKRDVSHPCIIAWVPFNESWGVPDLPASAEQRNYVQALYHLTKTLDPTRPVIGNDGWESVATDMIGIHDYDSNPERMVRRYGSDDVESRLLQSERPGGRMLLLGGTAPVKQPIVLTEFGGIKLSDEKEAWGYSSSVDSQQFLAQYTALLTAVRSIPLLAGFCYTQFTDTFQEANGLLRADRSPKAPLEDLALATSSLTPDQDARTESLWRKLIMNIQQRQADS